jgi:hypothetical protein
MIGQYEMNSGMTVDDMLLRNIGGYNDLRGLPSGEFLQMKRQHNLLAAGMLNINDPDLFPQVRDAYLRTYGCNAPTHTLGRVFK